MSALGNLRISTRLGLLIGFCIAGFAVFGVYAYTILNTVKVNGPY